MNGVTVMSKKNVFHLINPNGQKILSLYFLLIKLIISIQTSNAYIPQIETLLFSDEIEINDRTEVDQNKWIKLNFDVKKYDENNLEEYYQSFFQILVPTEDLSKSENNFFYQSPSLKSFEPSEMKLRKKSFSQISDISRFFINIIKLRYSSKSLDFDNEFYNYFEIRVAKNNQKLDFLVKSEESNLTKSKRALSSQGSELDSINNSDINFNRKEIFKPFYIDNLKTNYYVKDNAIKFVKFNNKIQFHFNNENSKLELISFDEKFKFYFNLGNLSDKNGLENDSILLVVNEKTYLIIKILDFKEISNLESNSNIQIDQNEYKDRKPNEVEFFLIN
jgi:hypothetical protein